MLGFSFPFLIVLYYKRGRKSIGRLHKIGKKISQFLFKKLLTNGEKCDKIFGVPRPIAKEKRSGIYQTSTKAFTTWSPSNIKV